MSFGFLTIYFSNVPRTMPWRVASWKKALGPKFKILPAFKILSPIKNPNHPFTGPYNK